MAVYTAVHDVHGPCTQACNGRVHSASTAVYSVHLHGRVLCTRPCFRVMNGPCTWPVRSLYTAVDGRIHRLQTRACTRYTAAYTGRKHGRVQGTRPCTRRVRVMDGPCKAVYMVRTWPCTRAVKTAVYTVHGPCTAMYTVRTRSGTGRVPGRVLPRTGCVHSRVRDTDGPCAWPCTVSTRPPTARVHGSVRTVYMAVYTAAHGVYGPCTPACNGRVHSASTAVYRVHLHDRVLCTRPRVLCTRPCLRSVFTAAHGRVQTVYTAVHGPRTWSVRDPITAVYREHGRLYGPCARHCMYRVHGCSGRVRIVYTGVQWPCTWCVHGNVQGTPTRSGTLYTALFTARVHGRSRPCTDCVHGRARATYMVRL